MNEDRRNKIEEIIKQAQREKLSAVQRGRSFDEKMQELGVEEKKSIIKWRKIFSIFMLIFLPVQYIIVIGFLILQGFNTHLFNLDNVIFYILISGTLIQSYFLVQIIFKYMFPYKR